VRSLWPGGLFARTALLIAGALAFSFIAWAAIVWTTIIPAAEATAHVLAERTLLAAGSYKAGVPLPEGVEVSANATPPERHGLVDSPRSLYLNRLRRQLQTEMPGSTVVVIRAVMPTEIWIRTVAVPDRWFILRWQIARPETPLAMGGVVLVGALLSLVGAAVFARRLTAPLAGLVEATRGVGEGEAVEIDTAAGPSEVRALAVAFQAMSRRLTEVDEQRELMLAGLSHDLRSPLARMRVAVDLIDPPGSDLHQQIVTDVEEIDRIVGQFLHYVRAGYRERPVRASADDIVRDSLSRHTRQGEVELQLNASGVCLIPVESVRRVLANLVQNALEYGRAPVTVRTAFRAGELLVSVIDRGEGIPAGEWVQAVRPFNRLRAAPGAGHSGLGLAIVERLVHAAHGVLTGRQIGGGFVVEATFAAALPEAE
jgi:two-component system osmolarity sensor histidine kinase EnvZ